MNEQHKSLWILNHYAASADMAGGTRHYELGRHLAEHGYDVTILASGSSHNKGHNTHLPPGKSQKIEEIGKVKFVWLLDLICCISIKIDKLQYLDFTVWMMPLRI